MGFGLTKIEYLILDLLRAGPEAYGLELVTRSGGLLKRGTVYVTLSRMVEKGYLRDRQELDTKHPGMPRRIYQITGLGSKMLIASEAALAMMEGDHVVG